MRRHVPVAVALAGLALAGCMTTRSDGSPKVETTSEANHENFKGAVSAPLRDFNVLRTKIPDVLLRAKADPYERPPKRYTCAQLNAMLEPLDDALGADLDTPPKDEDDVLHRSRITALGAVATATEGAIPFRGWVRKLTGAERHDALVQSAIMAGAVRRAYLKGLGEARGCPPPATPSHELAGRPVETQEIKPKYPIR